MIRSIRRFALSVIVLAVAAILIDDDRHCIAADKAKIQAAILKGHRYILEQKLTGAQGSIAVMAYVKSGGDKKLIQIQALVQEVLQKFQDEIYQPVQLHIYEASVDLMMLEAIDSIQYRTQMKAIVAYLLNAQQYNGTWYYPDRIEPDCGDTSITQYALMGLWAAARAKIPIPTDVLEKAALWQIGGQQKDGGFLARPFTARVAEPAWATTTVCTMTAAGSSNLLIIRRLLFGDAGLKPIDPKRRFGVLERFADEKGSTNGVVTIRVSMIDDALKESVRWMTNNFGAKSTSHDYWFCYDLYCIERVGALMDITAFGDHNWYDEGADELLVRQGKDGGWNDHCNGVSSTALGVMFLSKITAAIITPDTKIKLLGGGLQAGGRGLPDNLDSVQVKDGAVSARKIVGAVDNLLIELERSSDAKVLDVQAAVVDIVQLDRPDELIGQVERLRKLATDSRVEVRRTALWALGRSGNASAVPSLIRGLSDTDISVAREASLGLCILSRRPEGCGTSIDPTDDIQMEIKNDATDEQRKTVLEGWQKESARRWIDWYQKYRSYDEHDDKTTLKRTNK